ncbi:MAG: hypothetical protein NTY22_00195, partial [Proteobacteria bacterium]|nr:hypothetical protein [Pseudomonadota bacterium]
TLFSSNLCSQIIKSNNINYKDVIKEVEKAQNCIVSKDDICKIHEKFASILSLELLYANGLIDNETNTRIQTILFYHHSKGDSGTSPGLALGKISNYVSPSEKEHIYKYLKLFITNKYVPISSRISSAEALGDIEINFSIHDISVLLKELASDMSKRTYDGNDENGKISSSLFNSLANIYYRTKDYAAKDILIMYSNMNLGVYPLTQMVEANLVAGEQGIKETLPDLKRIARWHEVNKAGDLLGIWAIPLDVSRRAWSLIPLHIRYAENIQYPQIGTVEDILDKTLWVMWKTDEDLIALFACEMGISSILSIYGTELGAASSQLAYETGGIIAAQQGTTLSYELGVNTASRELGMAFWSTNTGKILKRVMDVAKKFKANIYKIKSFVIKPEKPIVFEELISTSKLDANGKQEVYNYIENYIKSERLKGKTANIEDIKIIIQLKEEEQILKTVSSAGLFSKEEQSLVYSAYQKNNPLLLKDLNEQQRSFLADHGLFDKDAIPYKIVIKAKPTVVTEENKFIRESKLSKYGKDKVIDDFKGMETTVDELKAYLASMEQKEIEEILPLLKSIELDEDQAEAVLEAYYTGDFSKLKIQTFKGCQKRILIRNEIVPPETFYDEYSGPPPIEKETAVVGNENKLIVAYERSDIESVLDEISNNNTMGKRTVEEVRTIMSKIEKDGLGNGYGNELFRNGKANILSRKFLSKKSTVYEIRVGCGSGINIRVYFSIEKNSNKIYYLFAEKKKPEEITLAVVSTITQTMKNLGIW